MAVIIPCVYLSMCYHLILGLQVFTIQKSFQLIELNVKGKKYKDFDVKTL